MKRGPGRPRTRAQTETSRHYIGFGVALKLKANLEAAARANGRSMSAEAVSRLERSFEKDEFRLQWEQMAKGIEKIARLLGEDDEG